jgi:hypothetical protein
MMTNGIRPLDVVALASDMPGRGLLRGQVGTVAEQLAGNAFEVEFADNSGKTFACAALKADQVIVLHFEPARDAS